MFGSCWSSEWGVEDLQQDSAILYTDSTELQLVNMEAAQAGDRSVTAATLSWRPLSGSRLKAVTGLQRAHDLHCFWLQGTEPGALQQCGRQDRQLHCPLQLSPSCH